MESQAKPDYIDLKAPISGIDCKNAFNGLELREKLYAYYFSRASWEGAKICYFQRSYESPAIFYLIMKIFNQQSLSELKELALKTGFDENDWAHFTAYLAGFLQNCGNYRSFGDTKFIPKLEKEKFVAFLKATDAYKLESKKFDEIWNLVGHEMFEYREPYHEIGMPNNNCLSGYYSANISEDDVKFVQGFLESIGVSALNTRLVKVNDDTYEVLVCSYETQAKSYTHEGKKINILYGDFNNFMYKLIQNLKEAQKYAANEHQAKMLDHYITHFTNGDVNAHKDSQREWIKDKGPVIETNIGFIEVYLDPMRVRAEFEGFVAVVDKVQSVKLNQLVERADKILENLPWPREFEKEKFQKPDFTSLNVMTFACSGAPIGINLPNYDEILQNDGFKNVDLGNCYPRAKAENIQYVAREDAEVLAKFSNESLFVVVALHELLGHGSGKLFKKENGNFNFDIDKVLHPLTGEKITTWYNDNETWGSKFGKLSSFYEECRADSVALYLSCFKECLEILLPGLEKDWDEIVYVAWYDIVLGAIRGLTYYSTETNQFGQSHIGAGYAIFRVLVEAGNGFVTVEEVEKDGKPYLNIKLDKTQIHTTGKKAMGEFLRKLQIYKTTADFEGGSAFFNHYLKVDETYLKYREIVLSNRRPRSVELQHDLKLNEQNQPEYVEFEETFEGIIKSHLHHYRNTYEDVYHTWRERADSFRRPTTN